MSISSLPLLEFYLKQYHVSDLAVQNIDDSLAGKTVDWIVTGSIAATETVKAIRSLRRLGAEVRVTMTRAAQRFITPQACQWASGHAVVTRYGGFSDHIATNDVLVVAPMTASFAAKAASALSDSPALSLFASYAGLSKPIIVHPNMHMSLWENPLWQRVYTEKLLPHVKPVAPVLAEDKQKFLAPDLLADHISHHVNIKSSEAVISFGGTEGKVDAVRYLTNTSSGALGSALATSLYRHGINTHVVRGACESQLSCYTSLVDVRSPDAMRQELEKLLRRYPQAALVMAAAVLDFMPAQPTSDKISSTDRELVIKCVPVAKIINNLVSSYKVVFKLQTKLDDIHDQQIANSLFKSAAAALVVVNIANRDTGAYQANIYSPTAKPVAVQSRTELAQWLTRHIVQRLQ
ncbi:MAG: hypothetical protein OYH77_00680 [Pseudomonadota bacterium]|nr:hypothetical protein [Pseudomonadota bacterium]